MGILPPRAGGDIERIVDRYQDTVYGLALVRTGNRADADDVFQEVFLAYYQAQKTFCNEEHRKAWLLRTTLNHCRRVTSSTWKQKTVPLSEQEEIPVQFQAPEENLVWQALQNLTEEYRLPIYLFYFQGLSTVEISKVLSIRPGTVRTRLSRGREQLREQLKGDYFNE